MLRGQSSAMARQIVRDENDRSAASQNVVHSFKAAILKDNITDAQHFRPRSGCPDRRARRLKSRVAHTFPSNISLLGVSMKSANPENSTMASNL